MFTYNQKLLRQFFYFENHPFCQQDRYATHL